MLFNLPITNPTNNQIIINELNSGGKMIIFMYPKGQQQLLIVDTLQNNPTRIYPHNKSSYGMWVNSLKKTGHKKELKKLIIKGLIC